MSHAKLRLERFKNAQAAIDEPLRLENRNNLDVTHQRYRMKSTLEQHRSAKRWFIEYLQIQTPELDPQRYFNPEHPPPDRVLIKKYAIFMALSRVGNIANTIAVQTLINYIRLLFTVLGIDRGRRLDKAVSDDVLAYVHNEMAEEYQLSREHWRKPVAHSEDLTYLLSVLYRPDVIGTLPNMRQLLNLTLFWNIIVDTGSRGGDIAWDRKTPSCTCLCWNDIKLYAFWDASTGATDIRANITFRYLKGMKLEPSQFKTIPFTLFPTSIAKEDTLRLILIMALMDGVLEEGIETWSDLMNVPSSETGIIIPIKESFQKLPLLRKVDGHTFALTEDAEQLRDLQALTRRLGRAAGLENRLTAYCLRRGVAFTLALKTSSDNRRFMMGHKTASRIYSEYASRIATVDLAALYRDQDPRQIKQMSSMRLNSSTAAPQTISMEGFTKAKLDPKYCLEVSNTDELREKLMLRHGTLAAAAQSSDPDFARYKLSYSRGSHALAAACRKIYDEEYAAFFQSNQRPGDGSTPRQQESVSPIPSTSSSRSSLTEQTQHTPSDDTSTIASDFLTTSASGDEQLEDITYDDSLPTSPDEGDLISEDINVDDDFSNIDPVLLRMDAGNLLASDGEEERMDAILGEEVVGDSLLPESAATVATGVQKMDAVRPATQSTRLHGISRRDQSAIDAYLAKTKLSRPPRDNSGIDRTYVDPTLCNHMLAVLDADGGEAELAAGLGAFFKTVHPIDRFFPGQEPLPGTYCCIFCDNDLVDVVHASLHVYLCALKDATDQTCRIVDELFPFDRPCTYTNVKKVDGIYQLVPCGKIFSDRQKFGLHVSAHVGGHSQMIRDEGNNWVPSCFHPPCAHIPDPSQTGQHRTGVVFQSKEERDLHLMTEHQIISTTSPKPTFCEFCYIFVLPHEADAHFELHIGDADSLVKANGYTGLLGLGRTLIPRICIFCYHDETLRPSQRLDTQCSQGIDRYRRHIDVHIVAISDAVQCPAFPDLCTLSDHLDSTQMREHLAGVHAIIVKETLRKGKRKKNAKVPAGQRKKKDGDDVEEAEDMDEDEDGDEDGDVDVGVDEV